jgi:hypothetical protein
VPDQPRRPGSGGLSLSLRQPQLRQLDQVRIARSRPTAASLSRPVARVVLAGDRLRPGQGFRENRPRCDMGLQVAKVATDALGNEALEPEFLPDQREQVSVRYLALDLEVFLDLRLVDFQFFTEFCQPLFEMRLAFSTTRPWSLPSEGVSFRIS